MNTSAASPAIAILWIVTFVIVIAVVFNARRKRRARGSAAVGAVWDLLNEDKRHAVEVIVEQRAEARDPEDAEGNMPDLVQPPYGNPFALLEFEGWQRVAGKYSDTWADLTTQFLPALLDAAGVTAGVRVLDVCCGPGFAAEAAHGRGAAVTGVDFAPLMITIARSRCPEIAFKLGNAQQLPFGDGEFDAVVNNFGLLHLPEPERAFAEASRVLRPGGRFAFTVWAGADESAGAKIVQDALAAHADMKVAVPQGPDYLRHGRADEWQRILGAAGFDPASVDVALVRAEWDVPTDFFLFEAERHAGVRSAALLAAQTTAALDAINHAMTKAVQAYARGREYAIPYAAYVVSVRRPG